MMDDKNERAAKGELLTHGERQLKGQPRENQPAMVSDRLQCKATSAAQGFPESDCHHP